MKHKVTCPVCGAVFDYDDKSVFEGNREHEDVDCPWCQTTYTRVFTDGFPSPRLIEPGDPSKKR